jgi:hypothetical protein
MKDEIDALVVDKGHRGVELTADRTSDNRPLSWISFLDIRPRNPLR